MGYGWNGMDNAEVNRIVWRGTPEAGCITLAGVRCAAVDVEIIAVSRIISASCRCVVFRTLFDAHIGLTFAENMESEVFRNHSRVSQLNYIVSARLMIDSFVPMSCALRLLA